MMSSWHTSAIIFELLDLVASELIKSVTKFAHIFIMMKRSHALDVEGYLCNFVVANASFAINSSYLLFLSYSVVEFKMSWLCLLALNVFDLIVCGLNVDSIYSLPNLTQVFLHELK